MVAFNFAAVDEESWWVCNVAGTVVVFNFAVEGSWWVCKVEDVAAALVVDEEEWWGGRFVFKCPLEGKMEVEDVGVALVVGRWGVGKVGRVVVMFNLPVTATCEALFDNTVLVCG